MISASSISFINSTFSVWAITARICSNIEAVTSVSPLLFCVQDFKVIYLFKVGFEEKNVK
jgi:hypothetical protein